MLAKSMNCCRTPLLKQIYFGCCSCMLTPVEGRTISTELTTALRPFYFAVHPDLFGQHPVQRSVNEDSLKQLSAILESLYERKYHVLHETKILNFYIRDNKAGSRDTFKLIKITLDQHQRSIHDPKIIIQHLLELCNLPTDYVKGIKSSARSPDSLRYTAASTSKMAGFRGGNDYDFGSNEFADFQNNYYQAREQTKKTLDSWLQANVELAKMRASELAGLKAEVKKLQKSVVQHLSLQDARYDCGWNYEHYRGCLKSLERMANLHEKHMWLLKGRIVVFAPFTGISREGHVMLFTGDVLNNWIEFIKNIPAHDRFLQKIPMYENTLSQVLRNIKVARRKFMPKQQAMEYANHLMKVTTTLGDYLTVNKFPKSWPDGLDEYEIVIESESGPLMVSPTGQMIAPATCPGSILVDFITTNLDLAKQRKAMYQEQKLIEKELLEKCKKQLQLTSLTKDDSVTPNKMIETLNNLIKHNDPQKFANIDLHITNYYSVLADGIVCIPWDYLAK